MAIKYEEFLPALFFVYILNKNFFKSFYFSLEKNNKVDIVDLFQSG